MRLLAVATNEFETTEAPYWHSLPVLYIYLRYLPSSLIRLLCGITWYCVTWYCVVIHGTVWYYMVLCGIHGTVWYTWYCVVIHGTV